METFMAKKLYKSNDRKICGVCGGIAEYFNIDPTIIRILTLCLVFFGIGSPIIVYFIAAFIMTDSPETKKNSSPDNFSKEDSKSSEEPLKNANIYNQKDTE